MSISEQEFSLLKEIIHPGFQNEKFVFYLPDGKDIGLWPGCSIYSDLSSYTPIEATIDTFGVCLRAQTKCSTNLNETVETVSTVENVDVRVGFPCIQSLTPKLKILGGTLEIYRKCMILYIFYLFIFY